MIATTLPALQALAGRWARALPSERATAQLYLTELCDALEVEKPRPAGTGYGMARRDGVEVGVEVER